MCNHPRCGNRARFVLTGPPFVEIHLCKTHAESYLRAIQSLKVVDKDEVLKNLGKQNGV